MPRRKQDCPKRMKWELENAEAAGKGKLMLDASADADADADGGNPGEENCSGASDAENGEMDSGDSDSGSPEDSRESSPSSPGSRKGGGGRKNGTPHPHHILPLSPTMISPSIPQKKKERGGDCPLDLSVSHKKPSYPDDGASGGGVVPPMKKPKWELPLPPTTTNPSSRERKSSWNGNHCSDIKALEKISEMSRSSHHGRDRDGSSKMSPRGSVGGGGGGGGGSGSSSSSSSWQAQWLAQNSTGTREIFKCVVCRSTFNTLASLSHHMKESKHGPPMPNLPSPKIPPQQSPVSNSNTAAGSTGSSGDSANLLLKGTGGETVQLPRKLVRGQDVWLGKGAEQTRQILKCMWCGQSFRSLAEMTSHMQQTQHYTNIISQEQLISWRSSEDKSTSANSHVSAVLTCKVCDQAFSSLKELSNHMVKNSHYKEHIMRSITESGSRRRQSREKRKKSLPVRKLLELERANQEMKKEIRITCEKCSEKIPGQLFVEHLRICGSLTTSSGASSGGSSPLKQPTPSPKLDGSHGGGGGGGALEPGQDLSLKDKTGEGDKGGESSSAINAIEKMIEKSFDYRSAARNLQAANLGPSPPIGTSILKRLGIDESVDYTKPLLDSTLLSLPPNAKYSRRSRSRSVSSEKSDDAPRSHSLSMKSNSNSSSPLALHNDEGSTKDSPRLNKSPGRDSLHSNSNDEGIDGHHEVLSRNVGGGGGRHPHPHQPPHPHKDKRGRKSQNNNTNKMSCIPSKRHKNNNNNNHSSSGNSLSALSSMFESIGGGAGENAKGAAAFPSNSHHPLAALQKLCDKTENTPERSGGGNAGGNSRPTSTSSSNPQSSPEPSLMGLNWAASAANAAAAADGGVEGNVFKCTFCETPFLSKGAYRLHLAKMHLVKESKSPQETKAEEQPTITSSDSPASKLIKYAELAKQLSSK